jgi:catechol 2,3-dioxygenase-like lactoylglutathione lyase family enzyme
MSGQSTFRVTRGIEHIGLTVPDIDQATEFFVRAFDAEVIYDVVEKPGPPVEVDDYNGINLGPMLGMKPGTRMRAFRMIRVGASAGLEMFEFDHVDQSDAVAPTDFGWQHVGFYVDDLALATEKIVAAGGRPLVGPVPMQAAESGEGNFFQYFQTPWGSFLEIVTIPSAQLYESSTAVRRWRPGA